jgi:translation initiation factor IF-2
VKLYEISAVTGKGIDDWKYALAEQVQHLREQDLKKAEQEAS